MNNKAMQEQNKTAPDKRLKDADNHGGMVPDDALQKANPAAAERATPDHDPHHVVKDHTDYDSAATKSDRS